MAWSKSRKAVVFFAVGLALPGCNQYFSNLPQDISLATVSTQGLQVVDAALNQQALAILQSRCASCHGSANVAGISYITDLDQLVGHGLVVPGSSASSRVYLRIADGSMPPSSPLPSSDVQLIAKWIDDGLSFSGPAVPAQEPDLGLPPQASDLTRQAVGLLTNRCASCHNRASGLSTGGGVMDMRDPALLVATGLAVPGDSRQSPLYDAISKGRMPKGSPFSAGEVALIRQWIDTDLASNSFLLDGDSVTALSASYASLRENVFATRCVLCHGGSNGTAEGLNLSSYSGTKNAALRIYDSVRGGEMPEVYRPLSASEVAAIRSWAYAGAPNN